MTELLQLQKTHKVLEVGTGSGYQAAILDTSLHGIKAGVAAHCYDPATAPPKPVAYLASAAAHMVTATK